MSQCVPVKRLVVGAILGEPCRRTVLGYLARQLATFSPDMATSSSNCSSSNLPLLSESSSCSANFVGTVIGESGNYSQPPVFFFPYFPFCPLFVPFFFFSFCPFLFCLMVVPLLSSVFFVHFSFFVFFPFFSFFPLFALFPLFSLFPCFVKIHVLGAGICLVTTRDVLSFTLVTSDSLPAKSTSVFICKFCLTQCGVEQLLLSTGCTVLELSGTSGACCFFPCCHFIPVTRL